ncbi:hypothetical protein SLE2022_250380 [Rubroshorea leprosula]
MRPEMDADGGGTRPLRGRDEAERGGTNRGRSRREAKRKDEAGLGIFAKKAKPPKFPSNFQIVPKLAL